MITYNELNIKAKDIEKQTGLQHLDVYRRYMFERILERISVSQYRNNFILKGGLLLSVIFGIESRNTRDMDMSIKGIDISKEKMVEVLNQILEINLNDNVKFEVVNITDIRQEDEYGGNKYHIKGKLENLTISLEIDISTGDEITPRELKYEYSSLFESKKIFINSYNIETILAEKIETVLRRTLYNARMKDFYDIYIFLSNMKDEININDFKIAFKNTLINRNSLEYFKDYNKIFDEMLEYKGLQSNWEIYARKNRYAYGIEFREIIRLLRNFLKENISFENI